MSNKKGGVFLTLKMAFKIVTILLSFFIFTLPAYAENGFQYSRLIQTNDSAGYKFIVLDKDVYAHSEQLQLQDVRIFDETNQEVPCFLDSVQDPLTTAKKESYIESEDIPFDTTQDGNETTIMITVNHLNGFRLELSVDDILERNYVLYGLRDKAKWYLSEGTLSSLSIDPSYPMKKEITWKGTTPFDKLQLVIHNRNNKPLRLNSARFSYYLDRLVFKDSGDKHYQLAYGNPTAGSPDYTIMNDKAIIKNEPLTQATLGAEVSTPQAQPPQNPENHKLLFVAIISVLAIFGTTSIGLSIRKRRK